MALKGGFRLRLGANGSRSVAEGQVSARFPPFQRPPAFNALLVDSKAPDLLAAALEVGEPNHLNPQSDHRLSPLRLPTRVSPDDPPAGDDFGTRIPQSDHPARTRDIPSGFPRLNATQTHYRCTDKSYLRGATHALVS